MKLYAIQFVDTGEILLTSNELSFLEETLMDMYEYMAYDNYCYNVLWCNVEKHRAAYDDIDNINKAWDDAYWYNIATYKIIDISDSFVDLSNKVTKIPTHNYDKTTIYTNCTVEIQQNTITGEMNISWIKTDETEEIKDIDED